MSIGQQGNIGPGPCPVGVPGVMGFPGSSFLDTGYFYAPYIPLQAAVIPPPDPWKDRKKVWRELREYIEIIRKSLIDAGYYVVVKRKNAHHSPDFVIDVTDYSDTIIVTAKRGRNLSWNGVCQVSRRPKARMNVFWTYDPGNGGKAHNEIDIDLADPKCFETIATVIVNATNYCRITDAVADGWTEYYSSEIGKVTI